MKSRYPEPLDETDEHTEEMEKAFQEAEALYNLPDEEYADYIDSLEPVQVRVAEDLKFFYSFRALPDELDFIGDAADLEGVDMSTFIRGAAMREARAVQAAHRRGDKVRKELAAARDAIDETIAELDAVAFVPIPGPSEPPPRRRKRAS